MSFRLGADPLWDKFSDFGCGYDACRGALSLRQDVFLM
jgi:hypothetical protein